LNITGWPPPCVSTLTDLETPQPLESKQMNSRGRIPGLFLIVAGAALAVAVAVGTWFAFRGDTVVEDPAGQAPRVEAPPPGPFRESAAQVGLTWQMRYLPNEQGEKFKINLYDHGAGLAVGDYNGDGRDDLYFCNQLGANALYRNRGDGTFEDVTAAAGVGLADRVSVAATFADYDNDGDQDVFVTSTRGGNVLFRNQADGSFEDVTQQAGLTHVGHSQTAVFFDYDGDGRLDLFLTNTSGWTTDAYDRESKYWVGKGQFEDVVDSPKEFNILYRNNGDGTFTDVTRKANLEGRGWAGDAVAFDYNDDGHTDLFVSCMFGRCQLYRNDGDGTFTDVTLEVLGRTSWGALGARVFDYNNDGRLDLYVVDMHSDMWMGTDWRHASHKLALESEKKRYPYRHGPLALIDPALKEREKETARKFGFKHEELYFGNSFYRNDGDGRFSEVSEQAGLETFWPWGIATGDFDNDGFEDVFVPAGMGYPFYYWPNSLLMNEGNGTFRDRSIEMGVEPPPRGRNFPQPIAGRKATRSSRAAVACDFTGSGRLDLVANNFNDQPYFFKNDFPRRNYVAFRLKGVTSNRDAIGAVVRLVQGGKVLTRQVLGACGYLAQSSRTLHFGLGDRPAIDRVEIAWPSGIRQRLDTVAVNTLHEVSEPAR
jgi:hypothetical protein